MPFAWILNPLTCLALLAIAMAACLYLFLTVKRELAAVRRLAGESRDSLAATIGGVSQNLEGVQERLRKLERDRPQTVSGDHGLPSTRRELALRMHACGETAASIATALQATRSEIELVLKVHRLTQMPE